MLIAGKDYIFKLTSPEFLESLFNVRRRYYIGGEPREIGKNKIAYLVAKFRGGYETYTLVGQGLIKDVTRESPLDRDYAFASKNGWDFVIDFESLKRYPSDVPAEQVFSESIVKKLSGQRPFGVALPVEESRSAKSKLALIFPEAER